MVLATGNNHVYTQIMAPRKHNYTRPAGINMRCFGQLGACTNSKPQTFTAHCLSSDRWPAPPAPPTPWSMPDPTGGFDFQQFPGERRGLHGLGSHMSYSSYYGERAILRPHIYIYIYLHIYIYIFIYSFIFLDWPLAQSFHRVQCHLNLPCS